VLKAALVAALRWFGRITGGARRPKQVRLYLYVKASAPHSGLAELRRVSLVCTKPRALAW
jgi:hypothetical protein